MKGEDGKDAALRGGCRERARKGRARRLRKEG